MKKRVILLCGGIISLVLYSFWAITFIVLFRAYPSNPNTLIQFLIITGILLIPGIFGVMGKFEKAYFILSFLGFGYILSLSIRGIYEGFFYNPNTFLLALSWFGFLSAHFYYVLFAMGHCKINGKANPFLILSYIGFFILVGYFDSYIVIRFVQEMGEIRLYGDYIPHWTSIFFYIIYPIVLVSTIFAVLKKQKEVWATVLTLISSIAFFGIGIYGVINNVCFDNVYMVLISLLAILSSIFAFVARPFVLNEQVTLEDNSNKEVHTMAEVKLDEPKFKEEKVEEASIEEAKKEEKEDDFDEEEAQNKLAKLKKLYQQGLIREEEYKKYVDEIVSKL